MDKKQSAALRMAQLEAEMAAVYARYTEVAKKGPNVESRRLSKQIEQLATKIDQVEKVLG